MDAREEKLNHDEQRISELIGTLRHVDAPGDFEPRVRAGIAARRGEKPRSSWTPILAGVAAVAVLAFGGYLGLRSMNSGGDRIPAQEVVNTKTTAPTAIAPTPSSVSAPTPASVATQENVPSVATSKQPIATSKAGDPTAGGFVDSASKTPTTLSPRGMPGKDYVPSDHRANDNRGLGTAEIPVAMILDGIGIHASWSPTGWRVDSVNSNTVGGRSGIKLGDVIESLDGHSLGEKTTFKGAFSGKSIRVRRDGATIELPIKP